MAQGKKTRLTFPNKKCESLARLALDHSKKQGWNRRDFDKKLAAVLSKPHSFLDDEIFGDLANDLLLKAPEASRPSFILNSKNIDYRRWGEDIEETALQQMANACSLPIAVKAALMPDAHQGYGLPIGGVLATKNAIIPYAVGVDIACRMKLSILDFPPHFLNERVDLLANALEKETRFGIGASFRGRRQHAVLDENWNISPLTRKLKDKAFDQLGTSGSGNHFVEFGLISVRKSAIPLAEGTYLALLSHSGSRGPGNEVATYYSRLAMDLRRDLPKTHAHLAWLSLDTELGQEYFSAMELMGKFAAANHACIHQHVSGTLGAKVLWDLENHHNFAWVEEIAGEKMVIHRKGATPAHEGELGIIPGTMASPAFVVQGKGVLESLFSASHGAGRKMSRNEAKRLFTASDIQAVLREKGVKLLSAGIDEAPMAYKDIQQVMDAQKDLVTPIATFEPKLVKMAPGNERPED